MRVHDPNCRANRKANFRASIAIRGLFALMLLHESRREARTDSVGDIVLLEYQDRMKWNQAMIREGAELTEESLCSGRFGAYTLQAAISAVHAEAQMPAETDWSQIIALYDVLLRISPNPVVQLNRAVAVAMRDGPDAGQAIIDAIFQRGELSKYTLAHAPRGELHLRLGNVTAGREALQTALSLSSQASAQRFLSKKLAELQL